MANEYVCIDVYTVQAGDTLYSIAQRYKVDVGLLMRANQVRNPYNLRIGTKLCIPGLADGRNSDCGTCKPGGAPPLPDVPPDSTSRPLQEVRPNPAPQPGQGMTPAPAQPRPGMAPQPGMTPMPAPQPRPGMTPAPATQPRPGMAPGSVPQPLPEVTPDLMPEPRPDMMPDMAPQPEVMPAPTQPLPENAPAPTVRCRTIHTIKEGDTLYMIAKVHKITLDALMSANPNIDPYRMQVGTELCIPE